MAKASGAASAGADVAQLPSPLQSDSGYSPLLQRARYLLRRAIDALFTCVDADGNQSITLDDLHAYNARLMPVGTPFAVVARTAHEQLLHAVDRCHPSFAGSLSRADWLFYHWSESRVDDFQSVEQYQSLTVALTDFVAHFKTLPPSVAAASSAITASNNGNSSSSTPSTIAAAPMAAGTGVAAAASTITPPLPRSRL